MNQTEWMKLLDGGMRQSLMIASRIAETLARRRQESQRQQEHQDAQAAHEAQARLTADRSAARAALAPVNKDQWWDKAQPHDIATAHAVAEGWKDHDPTALAASEKIRQEVLTRYGIDTRDVGTDAAYLESGIQNAATDKARQDALERSQEETRTAAAEHEKAMGLLAAARAEELRAQAATLAPEMERHQVPVEYLANPELAQALQTAHTAKTPAAVAAADATVQERLFLIGKDGINGPDIDQLRKETTANVNGAGRLTLRGSRVRPSRQGHARSQTPGRGRLHRVRTDARGTAVRTSRKGTLRPHGKRRPRDREPRHRQRQQPAQRPGPESRKHVGRRLRLSGTPGSFRRIPGNNRRQRNPGPRARRRGTQRGHTPQRSRHHGQGRSKGQEDPHRGSSGRGTGQERPRPLGHLDDERVATLLTAEELAEIEASRQLPLRMMFPQCLLHS